MLEVPSRNFYGFYKLITEYNLTYYHKIYQVFRGTKLSTLWFALDCKMFLYFAQNNSDKTKIRPKMSQQNLYYTPLNPNLVIAKKNQSSMQQFGDFVIFLQLRFYVKQILVSFENQNLRISPNSAPLNLGLGEFCQTWKIDKIGRHCVSYFPKVDFT